MTRVDNRPIGIFDSGLGGLTVLKAVKSLLPEESLVYFGDCGRTPYGVKSKETIIRYTFQNARFLMNQGVKLLVIACNTSSAYGFELLKNELPIPVIEVVGPGASAAVKVTNSRKIGVIGTTATVGSGAYLHAIKAIDGQMEVYTKACPLFVPFVEEGRTLWRHEAVRIVAEDYLSVFNGCEIDCLVLGCTHYPLLSDVIREVIGDGITLINSAHEVANSVKERIESLGIVSEPGHTAQFSFYTSDSVEKFEPLCSAILEHPIPKQIVVKIDIEKY